MREGGVCSPFDELINDGHCARACVRDLQLARAFFSFDDDYIRSMGSHSSNRFFSHSAQTLSDSWPTSRRISLSHVAQFLCVLACLALSTHLSVFGRPAVMHARWRPFGSAWWEATSDACVGGGGSVPVVCSQKTSSLRVVAPLFSWPMWRF